MKYIYDRDTDSLSVIFVDGRTYRDSEEIHDGVVIDYDTSGRPIAIEFPDGASRYVDTRGLATGEVQILDSAVAKAKTRRHRGKRPRVSRG